MKLLYYPWTFLIIFLITFPFGAVQDQFFSAAVIANVYIVYFLGFQLYAINIFESFRIRYLAVLLFGLFLLSLLIALTAHSEWGGYQFPQIFLSTAGAVYAVSFFVLLVMGSAALNQGLIQQGARSGILRVFIMNLFLMFTIFFFWGPLFKHRQPAPAPNEG